jgi:hypothetical protein
MNPSRTRWVWIGSIIAVTVIAVAIVVLIGNRSQNPSHESLAVKSSAPVYAPQGELVAQFPKDLILDPAAAMSQSYFLGYSSRANQYTAQFDSSSSMTTLYEEYLKFLPEHGWTITNNVTAFRNSRGIAAISASSSVQVSIVAHHDGSAAAVAYVTN